MDHERWDRWCEKGILGLVLAILIIGPLAFGLEDSQPRNFLLIQWLVVPLTLLWILRLWLNPNLKIYWPPLCWAILAFVLYALARYWTADLEYVARQEFIRILVYTLIFFVLIQNLRSAQASQIIVGTMIVLAAAISFYAIFQFVTDSDRVWHLVKPSLYAKRGSGTYICPDHLAGYLEVILPLALCYSLLGRSKMWTRIVFGYAALLIVGGLLVTVSRGGWISAGLCLALLSAWLIRQRSFRLRGILLLAVLGLAVGGFFLKADFSHSRSRLLSGFKLTEDVRFLLWKPAYRMWMDHFWWGVGPAHFSNRFGQYRPEHRDLQVWVKRVHNDYLNTLVDWGLVGGILMSAIWLIFFWQVLSSRKKVRLAQDNPANWTSNVTASYVGATFGLVAILIHSFGDYNLHLPANAIAVVTMMAIVTGFFPHAKPDGWMVTGMRWRVLVVVFILATLAFLIRQNWVRTKETFWLAQAIRFESWSDQRIRSLEQAQKAESRNYQIVLDIGESYRRRGWEGNGDLIRQAMGYFEQSSRINPYDANGPVRYGMCLDWLGKPKEAEPYYQRAHELDPNNYFITALVGWHYLNAEDYAESKRWLERSIRLYSADNFIAWFYLQHVKERLSEQKK